MFQRFRGAHGVVIASTAILGLIAVSSAAYALGPSSKPAGKIAASTDTTTTTTSTSTSTSTPPAVSPVAETPTTQAPPAKPAVVVATSTLNRVVLIDSATGKTTKVLVSFGTPAADDYCSSVGSLTVTPGATTAYFERHLPDKATYCKYEIWKVSTSGGSATKVVDGMDPAVSPDGTKLAYYKAIMPADPSTPIDDTNAWNELHIRTLATGADSVMQHTEFCGCGNASFAWAPDNKHMALQMTNCGCGGQPWDAGAVIDTTIKNDKGTPIPDPKGSTGAQWGGYSFLPNGELMTISQPQYDWNDKSQNMEPKSTPTISVIDPKTGAILRTVATGYKDRTYSNPVSDSSGAHLLYFSNGNLMVSDNGDRAYQLATGLTGADWK